MGKLSRLVCAGLLIASMTIAGCGDSDFKAIKEGSITYNPQKNAYLIEPIKGAPKVNEALTKFMPDGKWDTEKDNGREYLVFTGKVKGEGSKAETYKFRFIRGDEKDQYELEGVERDGHPMEDFMMSDKTRVDLEVVLIVGILNQLYPDYDFAKDGIPDRLIPKKEAEMQNTKKEVDKELSAYKDSIYSQISRLDGIKSYIENYMVKRSRFLDRQKSDPTASLRWRPLQENAGISEDGLQDFEDDVRILSDNIEKTEFKHLPIQQDLLDLADMYKKELEICKKIVHLQEDPENADELDRLWLKMKDIEDNEAKSKIETINSKVQSFRKDFDQKTDKYLNEGK